ncbi:MAG TPA: glycosyltransferase, partial [Terrimicrobiaceae bacterium]
SDSSTMGLTQIVFNLTEELVAMGHEVTLYAPQGSLTTAALVPLSDFTHASETILGKVLPVAAAFSDWRNFDIIHDHTRFYSTLFAHLLPIPLVSTVHHPIEFDELHWHYPTKDYHAFVRANWERLLDSVTTVFASQFQRERYKKKAEVIYNGIPLEKWEFTNTSAGGALAFLGAINETKGTYEAIQAALLSNEEIVIAGTTYESDDYFREKIEPFVDGKQVKFIGSVDFDQKKRLLRESRAVLMPIQWDDPFPTVAIESLASGTPVIAWNRSSMPEIVEDGKSGFLVSSIEEMVAKIKEVGKINRQECRARAELLFDSKQMARSYVALYQQLLGIGSV